MPEHSQLLFADKMEQSLCQNLHAKWIWYSLSLIAYGNTYSTFWLSAMTHRVYDMYSCMHNNTIYSSSIRLGRLINLKCKCVPSMFNQLTVKITFVVNVMFSPRIPPSSSYYYYMSSRISWIEIKCHEWCKIHVFSATVSEGLLDINAIFSRGEGGVEARGCRDCRMGGLNSHLLHSCV